MKHDPADALGRYRELLRRYHGTLDLLSDRGLEEVDRLIAEAGRYAEVVARVAPTPGTLLDVGSGAGLPGLVLALRLPRWRVVLTERRRKRASFLTLAVGHLGLENVEVVHGDVGAVEGVRAKVVVAQAVGTFAEVYRITRGVQAEQVVLVSRKGPEWRLEADALAAECGTAVAVLAEEPLEHRGTLAALGLAGGRICRSSA
ncbi:MAG TPA: RsmG family class I SAM-dependent methyltransferase [Trueperaceae bacterium]|nr:RsmG family class I SAM-dependent methyltransferase [Trueperaceae bacterium]